VKLKHVTLVADELLGYARAGGLGTATSFLAIALARMGHRVELLYLGESDAPIDPRWRDRYAGAGVIVEAVPRSPEAVEPSFFARMHDCELALQADPPDVVIAQDLAAPLYTALRLRHCGLGFDDTLFVVYCHGTRQWITDVAGKVRVLPGALGISVLERASVELADVVVSPSAYLLEWMKLQGWRLPSRSFVIPYLTQSAATGEPSPNAAAAGGAVERVVFFGRLEERKGLRPFAAGLNALDGDLLRRLDLEFLGLATPAWPPERVSALLEDQTRERLRRISFEMGQDQSAALKRLSRPGTLAVMPSLEDNSPNAVYECLERRIPFIASRAGGTAELIAPEDRPRVLFEPTGEGVAAALRRVLTGNNGFAPAAPAFDTETSYAAWRQIIGLQPEPPAQLDPPPSVDVVVSTVAAARGQGLWASSSEWIVLLSDEDKPDAELAETLLRAQRSSGADVVTCGIRLGSGVQHFFLGDPQGLGVLSNSYGMTALIRRSLLSEQTLRSTAENDLHWPLLAELALSGAKIVSVPRALVERRAPPGDLHRDATAALGVLTHFERQLSPPVRSLARLAAGLAAESSAHPPAARRRLAGLRRILSRR
jgi:glycosyltransferase involved in cell wall biosynthesis